MKSDMELLPCAYPEWQAKRIGTTFWYDFTIADHYGFGAIKDTWNRAFGEWKGNIKYLTELCGVMNHKCWQWYSYRNVADSKRISKWYADRYEEIRDYVYDEKAKRFSDDEVSFFTWVLD